MNIFGVGPWEVVLIAILALIFIGPEKLPEIMRQIGRTVGELRRMSSELTREFQEELAPLQELQSELTGTPKAGPKALEKPQQPTTAAKPMPPSASTASPTGPRPPSSAATAQVTSGSERPSAPVTSSEKASLSREAVPSRPEIAASVMKGGSPSAQDMSIGPASSEPASGTSEQSQPITASEPAAEVPSAHANEASNTPVTAEMIAPSNGPHPLVETKEELEGAPAVLPIEAPPSSAE